MASPSHAAQGDDLELRLAAARSALDRVDGFSGLRRGLHRLASDRQTWAGIPMPIKNQRLIIEPSYPKAKELMAIGEESEPEPDALTDIRIRNTFLSSRHRQQVVVYEQDGRVKCGFSLVPDNQLDMMLNTLDCADAWGIEQEARAIDTLGKLTRHNQFKQYLLTGMLLEKSKRSGLFYMFRRLRPTVVISFHGDGSRCGTTRTGRIICCLCMHPIGYYANTWAGAMCPTDDVLAMLMLMRGDEAMLWRRANQHHPSERQAGLS